MNKLSLTLITHFSVLSTFDLNAERIAWQGRSAEITSTTNQSDLRIFTLRTDEKLRDNIPPFQTLTVGERFQDMRVRTGSEAFDGLFTLALRELSLNSVAIISDPAFLEAKCDCYVSGRKWPYVWTRDIAYSTFLGLPLVDWQRTLNSMLFKLSPFRLDDSSQFVQDTGSGGSWPVSTDRVSFVLGANRLLSQVPAAAHSEFSELFYEALIGTIRSDRQSAYDSRLGLYLGEQSFLDWREQSNAPWTANHVVAIAESAAMSTNVLHYVALKTAADLCRERNENANAREFDGWAAALKSAINKTFWNDQAGLYITTTGPTLNPARVRRYDLLAQSLAVLFKVASEQQAQAIFKHYPQTEAGAPVLWPQDPDVPIYHNRAIWPFVTAFAIRAAAAAKNAAFVHHNIQTLVRGAALNLSHMENFEFTTLANDFDDGPRSGPVVNSQRQLWSVAGFIGVATDVIFGRQDCPGGVTFGPFLPIRTHKELFQSTTTLSLKDLQIGQSRLSIDMQIADRGEHSTDDSYDELSEIWLNGRRIEIGSCITFSHLQPTNTVEMKMQSRRNPASAIQLTHIQNPSSLRGDEMRTLFSPSTPTLKGVTWANGGVDIEFSTLSSFGVSSASVYRDGELLATGLRTPRWHDGTARRDRSACYSVTMQFDLSGNESYASEPLCYWPEKSVVELPIHFAQWSESEAPPLKYQNGRNYVESTAASSATFDKIKVERTGIYGIQLIYLNSGPVNTGITAALRRIRFIDAESNHVASEFVTVMPHTGSSDHWKESRLGLARLVAGKFYRVIVQDHFNMSDLLHFASYLLRGGRENPDHDFQFAGIRILEMGAD